MSNGVCPQAPASNTSHFTGAMTGTMLSCGICIVCFQIAPQTLITTPKKRMTASPQSRKPAMMLCRVR